MVWAPGVSPARQYIHPLGSEAISIEMNRGQRTSGTMVYYSVIAVSDIPGQARGDSGHRNGIESTGSGDRPHSIVEEPMLKALLIPVNATFLALIVIVAIIGVLALATSVSHLLLATIAAGSGFIVVVAWLAWTMARGEL